MSPGKLKLRWPRKTAASVVLCLVGAAAGTGLYFANLAYVDATKKPLVPDDSFRVIHVPTGAYSVALSPDGRTVAAGSDNDTVRLYDPTSGNPTMTLHGRTADGESIVSPDIIESVAFSPNGKTLAADRGSGAVQLWNTTSGKPHTLARAGENGDPPNFPSVAFSRDGKTIATTRYSNTVQLWNAASGKPLATLHGDVVSLAFSRHGHTVAGGGGNVLQLWNAASGTHRATGRPGGHPEYVFSVAFSPNGRMLASGGGADRTVRLWNVAGSMPRVIRTLRGHTSSVNSVAFSPDGETVASGSDDRTIRLWDAATGEPGATLHGHTDGVNSVAFSRDGKTLASTGGDSTIRIWHLPAG